MNAKLPAAYNEQQIKHLIPGETYWAVPWAMWADEDGNLWLNGNYSVHDGPGGTVQMEVWLVRDNEYGISYSGDYRWSGSDKPSYVGGGAVKGMYAVVEATFGSEQ